MMHDRSCCYHDLTRYCMFSIAAGMIEPRIAGNDPQVIEPLRAEACGRSPTGTPAFCCLPEGKGAAPRAGAVLDQIP